MKFIPNQCDHDVSTHRSENKSIVVDTPGCLQDRDYSLPNVKTTTSSSQQGGHKIKVQKDSWCWLKFSLTVVPSLLLDTGQKLSFESLVVVLQHEGDVAWFMQYLQVPSLPFQVGIICDRSSQCLSAAAWLEDILSLLFTFLFCLFSCRGCGFIKVNLPCGSRRCGVVFKTDLLEF
jgi:hypothetical protein